MPANHDFVSFVAVFLFTSILNTINSLYFALYSRISLHNGLLVGIGNRSSMIFIIGIYKPNIKRIVDPDIPGNIIADIATIPTTKAYIHIPILEKTNIHYMALKLERKKNYS